MRLSPFNIRDRPTLMSQDPLSDVLSTLFPVTHVAGAFDLGGAWAIRFPAHDGLKVYAVASGRAWLSVEGEAVPLRLSAEDCVILPSGRSFTIARDLSFASTGIDKIPEEAWSDRTATINGGGDTVLLAGHFAFTGPQTAMLLGAMPSILPLRDAAGQNGLRWLLERLREELSAEAPGHISAVRHLSHLLLVDTLRHYLSQSAGRTTGWLFAQSDPQIWRAAQAIHADPSHPWTIARLAATAGMSRSRFAERFRSLTGIPPMEYVTRWRMVLAQQRLRNGSDRIAAIAYSLGYTSEAAFSTAFKRVYGCAPMRYKNAECSNAGTSRR